MTDQLGTFSARWNHPERGTVVVHYEVRMTCTGWVGIACPPYHARAYVKTRTDVHQAIQNAIEDELRAKA